MWKNLATSPASFSRATRGRRSESGQAGVFVVLNLTLLFAILGLAVDVGWSYYKRHAAQAAADAAALSAAAWAGSTGNITCGSGGLTCGTVTNCAYPNVTTPTTALQEACLYAQANGFVNNSSQSVSAEANASPNAPPGVSGNSPAFWVLVNVSESPFTLFGNFAKVSSFNVNAQAISGTNPVPAINDVIVLSNSASKALTVTGNTALTVTGGGVYVDSNASNALDIEGSSSVTATTIKVHGTDSITGTSTACANGTGSCVAPTLSTTATPDPLATVNMPPYSGCLHTNFSASGGTTHLTHGVYCGGITVGGVATVTLDDGGDYILVGGGLNVGNSGILNMAAGNTGVTMVLTGNSTYAAAPFACTGSGHVTLTAPTSGTHRGLLFYQDRSTSGTYSSPNSIGASCVASLTGTLYFPTTALSFSGGTATTSTTSIVANTLSLTGSATYATDINGTKSALTTYSGSLIN